MGGQPSVETEKTAAVRPKGGIQRQDHQANDCRNAPQHGSPSCGESGTCQPVVERLETGMILMHCRWRMPVELHHVSQGDSGTEVLILHGLLGSSRNWATVARELGARHRVHALDLRNHGSSPHTEPFTYDDLVDDVAAWIERHCDGPTAVIGHSLGGKTAMFLACRHPDLVVRLAVVDASPCPTEPRWQREFDAMRAIDMQGLGSRQQAEDFLQQRGIDDWAFRKFLTSNIERAEGGSYRWRINLRALHGSLPRIFEAMLTPGDRFDGPTLLIRGGDSTFVPDADLDSIRLHFPRVAVRTIAGAGHNVHADTPREFMDAVAPFLAT